MDAGDLHQGPHHRLPLLSFVSEGGSESLLVLLSSSLTAGALLPTKLLKQLSPSLDDLVQTTQVYDCKTWANGDRNSFDVSIDFHPYVSLEKPRQESHHVKMFTAVYTPEYGQITYENVGGEGFFEVNPDRVSLEVSILVEEGGHQLTHQGQKPKLRIVPHSPVVIFFTFCKFLSSVAVARHVLLTGGGHFTTVVERIVSSVDEGSSLELTRCLLSLLQSSDGQWNNVDHFVETLSFVLYDDNLKAHEAACRSFLCYVVWQEHGRPSGNFEFGAEKLREYEEKAAGGPEQLRGQTALKRMAFLVVTEIVKWLQLL